MFRATTRVAQAVLPFLILAGTSPLAHGEHAVIKLEVTSPNGRLESFADHDPPIGGVNPRRHLTVKAGDPLVLQFLLTNEYPHKLIPNVTVRYFVVRLSGFGVKEVPDLKGAGVVTQGSVDMNFKPKCRVGARLKFQIDEPGIYLVRIGTLNTDSDHEHFSALDLEVK